MKRDKLCCYVNHKLTRETLYCLPYNLYFKATFFFCEFYTIEFFIFVLIFSLNIFFFHILFFNFTILMSMFFLESDKVNLVLYQINLLMELYSKQFELHFIAHST